MQNKWAGEPLFCPEHHCQFPLAIRSGCLPLAKRKEGIRSILAKCPPLAAIWAKIVEWAIIARGGGGGGFRCGQICWTLQMGQMDMDIKMDMDICK
jgi:hypothetical protein